MTNQDDFINEAPPADDFSAAAQPNPGVLPSLTEAKRKELTDLERKLLNHRETGAYMRRFDDRSEPVFDHIAFQEDQVRAQMLNRELEELRRKEQERERTGQERLVLAKRLAQELVQHEIQSIPADMRDEVRQVFVQIFNSASAEFGKSLYADRAKLEALLSQAWENAVGHVSRKRWTNREGGAPASSGLDAGDVSRAGSENKKPDEDPYTNNVMYAYERRKPKGMTFADAKKAQAQS